MNDQSEPESCRVRDSDKTRARDPVRPVSGNCELLLRDKGKGMKPLGARDPRS